MPTWTRLSTSRRRRRVSLPLQSQTVRSAGVEAEDAELGGGISLSFSSSSVLLYAHRDFTDYQGRDPTTFTSTVTQKVSSAMRLSASGRRMAQLLESGPLPTQQDVLHCTACTVTRAPRPAALRGRFTVLVYDNEYGALQAASGFPWGADMPHLLGSGDSSVVRARTCD